MRYIVIFMLCVASMFGATFTISTSQNWSAISGGPPSSADQVNINGDVVLTVDVNNATCSRLDIGETNNSTGIATLVMGTNSKLTVASQLRLGMNAANRDGKIIKGPGSEITGAGQLIFNNGYWASTATQESERWRYSMTSDVTTLATGPKQDVQLSYGSFIGTRIFQLYLQNTLGVATSQARFSYCIWDNCRDPIFGSTDSPNTTAITFDHCQFNEVTVGHNVTIRRASGGSGSFYMRNCGFTQTGAIMTILPTTSEGFEFSNNTGMNVAVTNAAASGNMILGPNILMSDRNTAAVYNLSDAAAGNVMTGDYIIGVTGASYDNFHPIIPQGSGGSGTHEVSGALVEIPVGSAATLDPGDLFVDKGTSVAVNIHDSLIILSADILVGTHTSGTWTQNITETHNTIANTVSTAVDGGQSIFASEGVPATGTVTIKNNIVRGNGKANSIGIEGGYGYGTQHISYSDYNNITLYDKFYETDGTLVIDSGNTTIPWGAASHDTAIAPQFFDETRSSAKWDRFFGSGTGTAASFAAYIVNAKNGFRGSPNYDFQGTATAWTNSMITGWVRYGFSPTVLSLRGTADDGTDRGAMPVRTIAGTFF